jgi:hypothetical protein
MSEPKDQSSWTPPRTWLLKQISAVVTKHAALTVDGWDEGGRRASGPDFAARPAEFKTRQATAEIIASLVTIAIRGPAIVAAIIAGYEPLPDKFGPGCGFRQRLSS